MGQLKQLHKFKLIVNRVFLVENPCTAFPLYTKRVTKQNFQNWKVGDLDQPHIKRKLDDVTKITRLSMSAPLWVSPAILPRSAANCVLTCSGQTPFNEL